MLLVLFNTSIGPYQVLPFRARAMAIKGAPHSTKLHHHSNLTNRLFSVLSRTLVRGFYPYTEVQSVYSTAPAEWANKFLDA